MKKMEKRIVVRTDEAFRDQFHAACRYCGLDSSALVREWMEAFILHVEEYKKKGLDKPCVHMIGFDKFK